MSDCPHDSMSGDEGPVRLIGRMPVRWRCDACDAIVYDDVNVHLTMNQSQTNNLLVNDLKGRHR